MQAGFGESSGGGVTAENGVTVVTGHGPPPSVVVAARLGGWTPE